MHYKPETTKSSHFFALFLPKLHFLVFWYQPVPSEASISSLWRQLIDLHWLTQPPATLTTHAAQTPSVSCVHYFYANAAHSISFIPLLLLSTWCFLLLLSLSASSLPASRQPPEEVRAVKRVFLFHTSRSSSHLCFLVPRLHCSVCSAQSVSCDSCLCQPFDYLQVLLDVTATLIPNKILHM